MSSQADPLSTRSQTLRIRVGCLTFFDPMQKNESGSLDRPYGIEALEELGFELHHIPVDWSRRRPLRDVEAVRKFRQHSRDVDVVFAMFESQANAAAFSRALRVPGTRRVPLVVLSCWLGDQVGHATGTRLGLLRMAYRSIDRLLILSSNQQDVFESSLGIAPTELAAIPFGVDGEWFSSAPTTDDGFVVCVGRDRGRDWPTLFAAVQGTCLKVRIACRPSELSGLRVPGEIEVLGFLPRDEYRQLLSSAALVVVSTHARAYPTGQSVAVEAMAMGKCVIASDTPAISDYLRHDDTAVLVPAADPAALRKANITTLQDRHRRVSIGESARAAVAENFRATHMWGTIADVLKATVAEHRDPERSR